MAMHGEMLIFDFWNLKVRNCTQVKEVEGTGKKVGRETLHH